MNPPGDATFDFRALAQKTGWSKFRTYHHGFQ